jgi:hypothetical protein
MRIKKKNTDAESSPDNELEQKVDAMMDLRAEPPANEKADDKPPEIDIFKDTKTAPVLAANKSSKHKKIEPIHPDELKEDLATSEADKSGDEPATEVAEADDMAEVSATDTEDKADAEAASSDEISADKEPLSDAKTDEVIDDIVKEDADKLLDLEDGNSEESKEPPKHHKPEKHDGRTFKEKLGGFFRAWWGNKWARSITILLIIGGIAALAVWPSSRYFVLNTAGARSSLSLKVTDESTGLPLKNVAVEIGDLQTKTDDTGTAKLSMVRLGSQQLKVERVAFASINKTIVVGWGSNPLGLMSLKATGAQYVFDAKDYLSNKAVKAEAVSGDASAYADKNGKIVLTVEDPETDTVSVKIQADEYRTEDLQFAATTKEVAAIRMVPVQPLIYVSKKSGKYDLYKVDVDGKNKTLLLAGTGRERQTIGLSVSPDGTQAALISSRGTKRDVNGYLLDVLTLINLKDNKTSTIDEAQYIRAVDWAGKRFIYTVTYAAPSAATDNRQRIISYNTEESARSVLANSDNFNGVISSKGFVYYAIDNSDPKQPASFNRIKADGSSKQTILSKQVWTIQQSEITKINLETPDGWYEYTFGTGAAQKGNPPAEVFNGRQYSADASGTRHAWVESRDGKGVLLVHDEDKSRDTLLVSASGVTMPVRWLSSNVLAYRISNSNETADYVKSLAGGDAKKISDVTATFGPNTNY